MITCKDVSDSASDYLDSPTTFLQRLGFRFHLIMCVHCRRYVRQLSLTSGVAKQLYPVNEPTDEEIERLVEKLKSS